MTTTLIRKISLLTFVFTQLNTHAQSEGYYKLNLNSPQQKIWGLGVEIQLDAIGSGNSGLPHKVTAIPHDLIPSERNRLYKDLLKGFRYCRLAMGLYFRGLDSSQKRIIERYPNQLNDLKELIKESGMEGISMEYWSCAPAWKTTNSYIGGSLKSSEPSFLNSFGNALVDDVTYLQKNGIKISMWGLQNEPAIKDIGGLQINGAPSQSYSHCYYSVNQYYLAFKSVAPKIRAAVPNAKIMVDSWDANSGPYGKKIMQDALLLNYIDAWVYHRVGANSNQVIEESRSYLSNTFNKPVYQNEFEYQHPTNDSLCLNTAQNIMNWFTFTNSPTWFWLHALKPTYNAEASGYSLGFWRPSDDDNFEQKKQIAKGCWDYNPQNFNAIAGFLKYMPWNARRYSVQEDTTRQDNRILAYKTPAGKMVFVLTNRSGNPFTFHIQQPSIHKMKGHRYTPSKRDIELGVIAGNTIHPIVPNMSIEFWVEQE